MRRLVAGLLAAIAVTAPACTRPRPPGPKAQSEVLDNIVYRRDRFGNCLAIVLSETYYGYRVVSIAAVPRCE